MKVYIIRNNVNRHFGDAGRGGGCWTTGRGATRFPELFLFFIFQYDLVTSSSLFVTFTVQKQW